MSSPDCFPSSSHGLRRRKIKKNKNKVGWGVCLITQMPLYFVLRARVRVRLIWSPIIGAAFTPHLPHHRLCHVLALLKTYFPAGGYGLPEDRSTKVTLDWFNDQSVCGATEVWKWGNTGLDVNRTLLILSIYNDDNVHHPVATGATAAPDTVCVCV